jgi:hypothetical protein
MWPAKSNDDTPSSKKNASKSKGKTPTSVADVTDHENSGQRVHWSSLELEELNRGARIATWGNVTYLIVTDIFGPSSSP